MNDDRIAKITIRLAKRGTPVMQVSYVDPEGRMAYRSAQRVEGDTPENLLVDTFNRIELENAHRLATRAAAQAPEFLQEDTGYIEKGTKK